MNYYDIAARCSFKDDDVIQNAILRTLVNGISINPNWSESEKEGYFIKCLYSCRIDKWRKISRDVYSDTEMSWIEVNDHIIEKIHLQDIFRKILKLNKIKRDALLMHIQGYEEKEIASIKKIPLGTVKSRIYHARKQLRKMI